jgi:hypothetical protein
VPSQVRIISGPRNTSFDHYIADLVQQEGYGAERDYFGCPTQERADDVRRRLRQAGRHLGTSVKAFWTPCPGNCGNGGPDCRFHVKFTAYDPAVARRYKAGQAQQQSRSRRK